MPAGPLCPARSRSSDPPLVVHRFGDPRVLGVRIVQVARDTGGNVGDANRRFTDVRAYAHVETDTSLTLSLHARARAWEDGVGEGHFVGARSRSEDRGVQRSRASRTGRERPTNTALAAQLEYSEAHSNATRGCGPGGDTVVAA